MNKAQRNSVHVKSSLTSHVCVQVCNRYVGINLSTLYWVLTLCLNLVPQKEKAQFWLSRSQSGWGDMSCMEEPCLGWVSRCVLGCCRRDSWDTGKKALIVSGLKNPPWVYMTVLLLHRVCRTEVAYPGVHTFSFALSPLGRKGDNAVWQRRH